MREIQVCDVTMKQALTIRHFSLSFKEKLEMTKRLDRLGLTAIEVEGIAKPKADSLRIKSLASLIKNSILAVPVSLEEGNAEMVWNAIKEAQHPRLQVEVAVSPANMEYIHHKKADGMLESVAKTIGECAALCDDVEFVAVDATRADEAYLKQIIEAAIQAGAKQVTIADAAGKMLPEEFAAFMTQLKANVPALTDVTLGVSCSDDLFMADACIVAAVIAGIDVVKATSYPMGVASLANVARIIEGKSDACQATTTVRTTEIRRATAQIAQICEKSNAAVLMAAMDDEETEAFALTINDSMEDVLKCAEKLGYTLSDEDAALVYDAFRGIAASKDVSNRELDSIIASVAQQVPPTYTVENYVINSGNKIGATASMTLVKDGEKLSSVCAGDGPIDAAFMAVEQIVGTRYDLEDFQLRSITEGQEAVGEAVVKLMSNGKIFSARGVSTDIVGATIYAYVTAINKIVYEEQM